MNTYSKCHPYKSELHCCPIKSCWGSHLRFWWKQGFGEAVKVEKIELNAGVGDSQLMDIGGTVPWTDVTLSREGGHCDGVLQLILWQVVRNPSINIPLK